MTDRDKELDALLSPLKTLEPTDLEMRRWQRATATEVSKWRRARPYLLWAGQLAAALTIGFFVGRKTLTTPGENNSPATVEFISVNS